MTTKSNDSAARDAGQTLEQIKARFSDRVKWVTDETADGDGYWACLLPGWKDLDGVSGVHEMSLERLEDSLSDCVKS